VNRAVQEMAFRHEDLISGGGRCSIAPAAHNSIVAAQESAS
jgi:hypothetical protein